MLTIIAGAFTGVFLFMAGFTTCFFVVKKPDSKASTPSITEVRRVKTSLRNPCRTYEVNYEQYKTRDKGLYSPVRPKLDNAANEVSLNVKD